ncbi:MAG: segregation/condensation protein A [Treponema sp.]|nr:segregation/condensation protein A [Treponema sp.]
MKSTESEGGQAHSFRLQEFEGPLELLLDLIRKNGINIYDIPIADITEQYLDYVRRAEHMDLDNVSEFHAMAALLLLIKSKMLLPMRIEEDGEPADPRQELVECLIEYQKFKKLSDLMEEKERDSEWVVERRRLQHSLPFTDTELWEKADIWSLMKTFASMMKGLPGERIIDMYEEVSVNEKVALMSELLEGKGECSFTDLIVRERSVMDIVCAFLAVLESVKLRVIVVFQNRMFGDILIRPNPGSGTEAGPEPEDA